MSERKVYGERTSLFVKDLTDQPVGKFIAFVEDMFGSKTALYCDGYSLQLTPGGRGAINLLRESVLSAKPGEGTIIAAFSSELKWALINANDIECIKNSEWEKAKFADAEDLARLSESIFGSEKVRKVMVLPDGREVVLPLNESEKTALPKIEEAKIEKKPYDDSGLYA